MIFQIALCRTLGAYSEMRMSDVRVQTKTQTSTIKDSKSNNSFRNPLSESVLPSVVLWKIMVHDLPSNQACYLKTLINSLNSGGPIETG